MATGTVTSFNAVQGYGFIAPDDDSANVFVNFSAIDHGGLEALQQGQRVEYEAQPGPEGLRASTVRPL